MSTENIEIQTSKRRGRKPKYASPEASAMAGRLSLRRYAYRVKPTPAKAISLYTQLTGIKPEDITLSIKDIMTYVDAHVRLNA